MAVPSKAEQVAEAQARAKAGIDPAMSAAALDVIDDGPRGDPQDGRIQPRPTDPDAARAPPPVKAKFDDKRAEIIARFRGHRTEEAAETGDDISDFQRTGMPPEWEPQPPQQADQQTDGNPVDGDEIPAAAPQTHRVKVHGKEMDLTLDELIANAQIALASDNLLDSAKARLKEVEGVLEEARNKVARVDQQQPQHQRTQQPYAPQPGTQPQDQPDPADPEHHEDPLTKLIEAMQFGDPKDAAPLLQNTIAKLVDSGVQQQLQRQRLQDEGARAAKVLADFEGQHADIAKDPMARAAIEAAVLNQQIDDIKALGVGLNQIRPDGLDPTPGDVALAHRWYRSQGFKVSSPETMLEDATKKFLDWRGTSNPTPADPVPPANTKAEPRIEVSVERRERRAAAPQQPNRSGAPPRQAAPPAPQVRDRSQIVQDEIARRNRPRGRVGVT